MGLVSDVPALTVAAAPLALPPIPARGDDPPTPSTEMAAVGEAGLSTAGPDEVASPIPDDPVAVLAADFPGTSVLSDASASEPLERASLAGSPVSIGLMTVLVIGCRDQLDRRRGQRGAPGAFRRPVPTRPRDLARGPATSPQQL